jgi:hypothetical protein
MDEKIDVIAVMKSGVPYAIDVFESYSKSHSDVRLLTFYPTTITIPEYRHLTEKDPYSYEITRLGEKLAHFNYGLHNHVEEFINIRNNISQERIDKYSQSKFVDNSYSK